ncbi:MAG: DUF982 domain-containing protein [Pararhizobium sp.]
MKTSSPSSIRTGRRAATPAASTSLLAVLDVIKAARPPEVCGFDGRPLEARDWPTAWWPRRDGIHFVRAIAQCQAALAGRIQPETARQAFLFACLEAGILAH